MAINIGGFDLGINMPTISSAGWWGWFKIALIVILFLIVGCILLWMWWRGKVFNKKIILFENIAGQGFQKTGEDRARIVKVGDGGEELLYLLKRKVYRTAYGRKMGKNTYWFAVGQDGYWYNILLGDLDAKMGMLDIEPIDRDMRYMHVAIRKNIQERYRKIGVMEKYGTIIMSGIFLIIMIIAIWLLMSKAGDLIHEGTAVVTAAKDLIEPLKTVASKIDNICSAAGIRSA